MRMSNPFLRLKALLRKPAAEGSSKPATLPVQCQVRLDGFGPQVAMRLHRAQRTAAMAGKETED